MQITDPDRYVQENREKLVRIIKHGTDPFVRALAMAILVEYGTDPDIEKVRREFDTFVEMEGSA